MPCFNLKVYVVVVCSCVTAHIVLPLAASDRSMEHEPLDFGLVDRPSGRGRSGEKDAARPLARGGWGAARRDAAGSGTEGHVPQRCAGWNTKSSPCWSEHAHTPGPNGQKRDGERESEEVRLPSLRHQGWSRLSIKKGIFLLALISGRRNQNSPLP